MKFKKALVVILSLAMIVTLMPATAFATSTNTVAKVPTVASDDPMPETTLSLEVKDTAGWAAGTEQKIKLSLTNAKWNDNPDAVATTSQYDKYTFTVSGTATAIADMTITNVSSGNVTVTVTNGDTAATIATAIKTAIDGQSQLSLYDVSVSNSVSNSTVTLSAKSTGTTNKPAVTGAPTGASVTVSDSTKANAEGSIVATKADTTVIPAKDRVVLTPTASTGTTLSPAFISASDTSLEFSFTPRYTLVKGSYVTLTIPQGALKSGTDDGAVIINIDGLDSNVTSAPLTVANVGSSTTTATVNGTVKTFGRSTIALDSIKTSVEIRETAVNSLKENDVQIIKMTLPKGVTWNAMKASGDMISGTATYGTGGTAFKSESTNSTMLATPGAYISSDRRTLYYAFTVASGSETVRNVLTITPSITISKTASTGDINMSLVGVASKGSHDTITDTSDLLIAKYGDESVNVYTTDTVPTIYSGYTKDSNDKNFTFKITLDESMTGSLTAGKYVDFNLPEGVQISDKIKAKLNSGSNTEVAAGFIEIGEDNIDNYNFMDVDGTSQAYKYLTSKDNSSFSFLVPDTNLAIGSGNWKTDGANKITFEVPVTVDAAYTGDITCNVSGSKAGLDKDYDVVVAKAESPITVTTKTTEVKTGVQTQQTADITITENVAGYLNDETNTKNQFDDALVLSIDTLGLTKGMVISSFDSATVTAGDLELGTVKIKSLDNTDQYTNGVDYDGADVLVLPIKHSSTKVSTIEIKGVKVTLNRTLPEGGYNLEVGGHALINNGAYDNGDLVNKVVAAKDYVKIITPADSSTVATKIDATFVVGQASYTNNGTAVTMDAAPYIDSNSRTMVPIRYIAEACGVDNADITWNQATQTAKINGAKTVVTITMGSNIIQTSTGTITMDTTPVNSNGRIYVPLRFIANALNANVTWDGATKTITVTNGSN